MDQQLDLYEILEVAPDVDPDALTAAYRRLLFKYHPDHNDSSDAAARTAAISRAYRILGNIAERAQYDRFRSKNVHPRANMPRAILGAKQLKLYEWQEQKPKHGQMRWEAGIWSQISSEFPVCRSRGCLVLLQLDPKTGRQMYQHGDPGPVIEIDPNRGEFKLLKPWLDFCHEQDDARR